MLFQIISDVNVYDESFQVTSQHQIRANKYNTNTSSTTADHQKMSWHTPKWQQQLNLPSTREQSLIVGSDGIVKKHYLTAAFVVRLYDDDKAKWTLAELKQWMHYLMWAGVEHFYLCDHYQNAAESLQVKLQRYIDAGLLTYFAQFNDVKPVVRTHISCWNYLIKTRTNDTEWQLGIDMDEYPFVSNDTEEGFLVRFLNNSVKIHNNIAEVSMHNYLMLGGDRRTEHNMTIERITRIVKQPNTLDKPIYKPTRVMSAGLHHMGRLKGYKLEADGNDLKMLHYWGGRLSNWGPLTDDLLKETIEFFSCRDQIAPHIRDSLMSFGEDDAFNHTTGP